MRAPAAANSSTADRTTDSTSGSLVPNPSVGENAIRTPATPPSRPSRNDDVGVGKADQSRESNPLMMSSSSALSRTDRVIGPAWASVPYGLAGHSGISP